MVSAAGTVTNRIWVPKTAHDYPTGVLAIGSGFAVPRPRKALPVKAKGLPKEALQNGAGEETRTLDVHLGKVVLYQLSYARKTEGKN
jgi:hypothetical protein